MKYFGWHPDYVLWEISYPNLVMYMLSIPDQETKKEDKKEEAVEGLEGLSGWID